MWSSTLRWIKNQISKKKKHTRRHTHTNPPHTKPKKKKTKKNSSPQSSWILLFWSANLSYFAHIVSLPSSFLSSSYPNYTNVMTSPLFLAISILFSCSQKSQSESLDSFSWNVSHFVLVVTLWTIIVCHYMEWVIFDKNESLDSLQFFCVPAFHSSFSLLHFWSNNLFLFFSCLLLLCLFLHIIPLFCFNPLSSFIFFAWVYHHQVLLPLFLPLFSVFLLLFFFPLPLLLFLFLFITSMWWFPQFPVSFPGSGAPHSCTLSMPASHMRRQKKVCLFCVWIRLITASYFVLKNCDKIMHLRFNFDARPMHSPFGFVHLTHQNLSVCAFFCHNSLAK